MGGVDVMGPVPAHTYARLRFNDVAEQAVQHLSNVLQYHRGSPYEGQFVSQLEPRAGMGCSPPHIALLSGLQGTGMNGQQLTDVLQRIANTFGPVQGRLLPRCKVTQNGCVLLGVDSPDSLRMAQALAAMLPGADMYYAQQRPEQQHLTLGRFAGTDAAGFAAWLSESLAGQNDLLPTFTGSHVQLSDEARPFPNVPIPLQGMSNNSLGLGGLGGLGNGVASNGFGGQDIGSIGGGFDSRPSNAAPTSLPPIGSQPIGASQQQPQQPQQPPTYASAMASGLRAGSQGSGSYAAAGRAGGVGTGAAGSQAAVASQSPEALLQVLQSMTAGAEGVGVLGATANGGCCLRPQESAAWSQRLQPLVATLQGVLSNVGGIKFLQMLDRVANPHDWSIATELQSMLTRGARLEVVQDLELAAAIEATQIARSNMGVQVRLSAVPVNQAVAQVPGHSNTGSPVVVCRLKDGSSGQADPATGLIKGAALALHLDAISQLDAADKPYLLLTFGFIGLRPPTAAQAAAAAASATEGATSPSGGGGGGGSSVSAASVGSGPGGSSSGVRRPGDWTCPSCHAHNFASRGACFKCKQPKTTSGGGGSGNSSSLKDSGSDTFSGGGKDTAGTSPGGGPSGNFRPGDWICVSCRAHNFASRSACFKCKQRKSGSEGVAPASSSSSAVSPPENFRSGDWMCGNCRAHNFASRAACFKCSAKPS